MRGEFGWNYGRENLDGAKISDKKTKIIIKKQNNKPKEAIKETRNADTSVYTLAADKRCSSMRPLFLDIPSLSGRVCSVLIWAILFMLALDLPSSLKARGVLPVFFSARSRDLVERSLGQRQRLAPRPIPIFNTVGISESSALVRHVRSIYVIYI